eukprot:TRINITY_DN36823_c0_g1_i1.p1 TRINITY_DN36823_c0_g1~~TRINITY_DN36823_c0_g1_i1.p1  ORF type:complete len:136 (+),score=22.49 TRINITY_DN36823_c0_g1_i1:77-484(+)
MLAAQTSIPSWSYMSEQGGGTLWERWNGGSNDGGQQGGTWNHIMFGSQGAWYYKGLAGLSMKDENTVAWSDVTISPYVPFNTSINDLSGVDATVETIRGLFQSSWSILQLSNRLCEIGRAVQQECRDRSRMPSSA